MIYFKALIVAIFAIAINAWAGEATFMPELNPTENITYWKPFAVSPKEDRSVANAHEIFSQLLRAWSDSRVPPKLYVVNSNAGPWAASLADGNILLSRGAIDICNQFGKTRANHLLAFVLGHELAHQRADDLWHVKFFRLAGNQTPEVRQQILKGFKLSSKLLSDIEQQEAQADHDGILMMATVGYDPFQVLDDKDFFTNWVENIWQTSCASANQHDPNKDACELAKIRALRTRTQLTTIATQSTLYDLGIQAFIAHHYKQARQYFIAFGRDFPSQAVHSSIGLTHLAQALRIRQEQAAQNHIKVPVLYYPIILEANPRPIRSKNQIQLVGKRGKSDLDTETAKFLLQSLKKHLKEAVSYFERAIRLDPNHRVTYLLMSMSYLLDNNTYMARGVVQGKFIPKFGAILESDLMLAMISIVENKHQQAENIFSRLLTKLAQTTTNKVSIPMDLMEYTAVYNYTVLKNLQRRSSESSILWKQLADQSRKRGKSVLFRLALHQLNAGKDQNKNISFLPTIHNLRIGEKFRQDTPSQLENINKLWLEGELLQVYRFSDGGKIVVDPQQTVIGAWQEAGPIMRLGDISTGDSADRPLKILGIPSHNVHMISGEYLAYDHYGLAFFIVNDRIAGWFLYSPS